MKNLMMLAIMCSLLPSCGKRKDNECKSRESARLECVQNMRDNYGYPYAVETCSRTFTSNRCY